MKYRKYFINSLAIAELLEIYCEGKPFWWNWFFSWRGTYDNGAFYIIPEKIYNHVLIYARKHLNIELLTIPL